MVALALAVTFFAKAAMSEEPLLAGVAVGNITPDTGQYHVQLGGYGDRQAAPAEGVHDYALAKALVLKQGGATFVLVTTDLLGISGSLREEVLARIVDTGIDASTLMLTASHCHASTEMNAMNRKNVFGNKAIGVFDEALLLFTAERIAETIVQAETRCQPVRAGTGSVHLPGMNRNRRGAPSVDDEMTVTRFDTEEGKPLAVLVNWAAHPTFMVASTMQVSAGWPGYLQRTVEAFLGEGAVCMYTNGAEGDIAPRGGRGASEFEKAEDYGRRLAVKALELIPNIETRPGVELAHSMTMLDLPERQAPPALLDEAGPEYGLTEENVMALVEAMAPETAPLGVLRVGGLLAIAIPGEMTASLGVAVKRALREAGAENPVIAGLGNEWISYMLAPDEYGLGGYEPGVSFYGDQLGKTVAQQAIAAGRALIK